MEPTPAHTDALYRQKIFAARQQSPEEKLLAGGKLFDELCERMRSDLRLAHPGVEEHTITRLLCERLKTERDAEEEGIYISVNFSEFPIPPLEGPR